MPTTGGPVSVWAGYAQNQNTVYVTPKVTLTGQSVVQQLDPFAALALGPLPLGCCGGGLAAPAPTMLDGFRLILRACTPDPFSPPRTPVQRRPPRPPRMRPPRNPAPWRPAQAPPHQRQVRSHPHSHQHQHPLPRGKKKTHRRRIQAQQTPSLPSSPSR